MEQYLVSKQKLRCPQEEPKCSSTLVQDPDKKKGDCQTCKRRRNQTQKGFYKLPFPSVLIYLLGLSYDPSIHTNYHSNEI